MNKDQGWVWLEGSSSEIIGTSLTRLPYSRRPFSEQSIPILTSRAERLSFSVRRGHVVR